MINKYICENHREIKEFCTAIKKSIKSDYQSKSDLDFQPIVEALNQIQKRANEAWKQGKRMEARMARYREAIEDLGFERKETKRRRK